MRTRKYIVELFDAENEYITCRAFDSRSVDEAVEKARALLAEKRGRIARVYRESIVASSGRMRRKMVACATDDGEVCKKSWIDGTSKERG